MPVFDPRFFSVRRFTQPITCAACSLVPAPSCVLFIIRMASRAVRNGQRPSKCVFGFRDCFKMCRINTSFIPAQVINVASNWYRAIYQFICNTVRLDTFLSVIASASYKERPITQTSPCFPLPAVVIGANVNMRPKTLSNRLWLFTHSTHCNAPFVGYSTLGIIA
jgi:hypothetical protein